MKKVSTTSTPRSTPWAATSLAETYQEALCNARTITACQQWRKMSHMNQLLKRTCQLITTYHYVSELIQAAVTNLCASSAVRELLGELLGPNECESLLRRAK